MNRPGATPQRPPSSTFRGPYPSYGMQRFGQRPLDSNDFPALGTPASAPTPATSGTSYASQAGTPSGSTQREPTSDDFPALEGPPGLNGFERRVHPGFQSDDKRNYALKQAAWNATPPTSTDASTHPTTPAQQILMSAADRWGLLGLLAMIKSASGDGLNTDLSTMGLDMNHQGNLYSSFVTPWSDSSALHSIEPDFVLPACYNVAPPPPGPGKATAFSDETLFFMFYSSPRDALQEVAAQELWNRNWRFHRELRLWITKETGTSPSAKLPGGEQGTYTFWDPELWEKQRKEMPVLYQDLEEKSVPAFAQSMGLVLAGAQATSTPVQRAAGNFM